MSVNKFTEFNVDQNGLVLNNSTTSGVSIIGQNVTANPNLMVSGPANTIVNEVISAAPSYMSGPTEVFGQSAAVVIANPNGISCNGCSFLNATSSTLTTGKPIINGSDVDLLVTQGTITIGSDGFAAGPQAGLLGRHLNINGAITTDAQAAGTGVLISGGAQRVNGLNVSNLGQTDIVAAPSTVAKTSPFAIDASDAGLISSGNVTVLNREVGQGVNLYGSISADAITVQSAGDLFYKNVVSQSEALFVGQNVRQYDDLNVQGNVQINADQFTLYEGRTISTNDSNGVAQGDVTITADTFVVIAGEVSSDDITIDVTNGSLTNTGFLLAEGDLVVQAGEHVRQQREIAREYDTNYNPALQQYIQAYYAQLLAGGPEADLAAELIARARQYDVVKEHIDRGATTTGTNVTITATEGDVSNTGGAIAATNDVRLEAGADIINSFLALQSRLGPEDGCASGNCGYRTDFHAGEILAGNDLDLNAGRDIRNEASNIAAANDVTLVAGRDVINSLKQSSFATEQNVPVSLTGQSIVRCDTPDCGTLANPGTVTTGIYASETDILSPAQIASLYGDVDIVSGRDVVVQGSDIPAGRDLTIDAAGEAILAGYSDRKTNFIENRRTVTTYSTYRGKSGGGSSCSGYGKQRNCTGNRGKSSGGSSYRYSSTRTETTRGSEQVLVTATSNLIGQSVSVSSEGNLTLSGARILASADLDLNSTSGAVLIDADDVPGWVASADLAEPELRQLSGDLAKQIFGSADGAQGASAAENTAAYIAFLLDNEVLTAVEALRRADSGADIKDVAKAVGAQSYASLIDSNTLEALKTDANTALVGIYDTAETQIQDFQATSAAQNQALRSELERFSDLLSAPDETVQAALQAELDEVDALYASELAVAEQAYSHALAVNHARYGHLLTRQVLGWYPVRVGIFTFWVFWWHPVPNTHYVNLKNTADWNAAVERNAALDNAATQHALRTAQAQATYTDEGLADHISNLSAEFEATLIARRAEKAALFDSFQSAVSDASAKIQTLTHQQALADGLANEFVRAGSVRKGEASLAAALTNDAFPELARLEETVTRDDGVVENRREYQEERTRIVTREREVGEYQESVRIERQRRTSRSCRDNGKRMACTNRTSYVDVEIPETKWVVTGTEQYQEEETYFETLASQAPLLSGDKAEQDALLNATAWRFAAQDAQPVQPLRNRLLSQQDLSITAQDAAVLGEGQFEAFGQLNVASFGNVIAKGADLEASDIQITAGGKLFGAGLSVETPGDISLLAGGNIDLGPLSRSYTLKRRDNTGVIGTLHKHAGVRNRDFEGERAVSHQLSTIRAGGDVSILSIGDVGIDGVQATVGGDVQITTNSDLTISASKTRLSFSGFAYNSFIETAHLWPERSYFQVAGDFSSVAGGNTLLEGARIDAGGGLDISTGGDLTLTAAQKVYTWFGVNSSDKLDIVRVNNYGTNLAAEGTLSLRAETGDLITAGSRLESRAGDINLSADQGDIKAGTFQDTDYFYHEHQSSSLFGLISSSSSHLYDYRTAIGTTALSALDLTLVSGGDTRLIGAHLSAGRDLNLNVGGDLRIEAAISQRREEHFESKMGAVLATTKTEKSFKETAVLTSLNANGEMNISVGGNTYLTLYNYEDGERQTATDLYPEELTALANLILLDETLLDEYFYDETKALSPAFTAVLSAALSFGYGALLTGPLASSLAGTSLMTTAGTLTTAGKALAAFAASSTLSIASGAVSGDLDIGEILQNAALAAATQYLTASINLRVAGDTAGADEMLQTSQTLKESSGLFVNKQYALLDGAWGDGFTQSLFGTGNLSPAKLFEGAFDATLSNGISSAVTGSDFGKGLSSSLVRTVVALGLADVQNEIGDIFDKGAYGGEGSLGHIMLHGLAGCAAAELQGASCSAGAAGGVAQAIYAGAITKAGLTDEQQRDQAEIIGALVGYAFSGGEADNVSVASAVALSGIINNRQLHRSEAEWIRDNAAKFAVELELCETVSACSPAAIAEATGVLTTYTLSEVDSGADSLITEAYFDSARIFLESQDIVGKAITGTDQRYFIADAAQRDNAALNAEYLIQNFDLYKAATSQVSAPLLAFSVTSAWDDRALSPESFAALGSELSQMDPADVANFVAMVAFDGEGTAGQYAGVPALLQFVRDRADYSEILQLSRAQAGELSSSAHEEFVSTFGSVLQKSANGERLTDDELTLLMMAGGAAMAGASPAAIRTITKTRVFNRLKSSNEAATTKGVTLADDVKLLPPPSSIGSARRLEPGVASHGGSLPTISESDTWLRGTSGNAGRVPSQVAEQLSGQQFRNFDHFREEFWKAAANDPVLSRQFTPQNRALMRDGLAPFAPSTQQQGGRVKYELDHNQELQNGGNVYDMNNIVIRTPLNHIAGK